MTDVVGICNLALQKLGAKRITALTEDSERAREMNTSYEPMRDVELRAHPWNFAISRKVLAPLATAPAFDFDYAFPVPADFLRLYLPNRTSLDWRLEYQDGQRVILTNEGASLNVPYIAKVVDPTLYDPLFVEALACRLAMQTCEKLTQSNEKKRDAQEAYKQAIATARRTDAIENTPDDPPPDSWDVARVTPGSNDLNFVSQPYGFGIF